MVVWSRLYSQLIFSMFLCWVMARAWCLPKKPMDVLVSWFCWFHCPDKNLNLDTRSMAAHSVCTAQRFCLCSCLIEVGVLCWYVSVRGDICFHLRQRQAAVYMQIQQCLVCICVNSVTHRLVSLSLTLLASSFLHEGPVKKTAIFVACMVLTGVLRGLECACRWVHSRSLGFQHMDSLPCSCFMHRLDTESLKK